MENTALNTVIAICAVVIALGAFLVSIWQGYLTRKHNRLSVKPYLRVDRYTALNERPGITLTNKGIGTAIIKEFIVYLDGNVIGSQGFQPPVEAAIRNVGYQEIKVNTWVPEKGDPISSGETNYLLELLDYDSSPTGINQLLTALRRITFRIEYESMYGEKFCYDDRPT